MRKAKIFLSIFVISALLLCAAEIHVVSPNGGESWAEGSNQTITWSSTGITSGHFRIFLFDGTTELGTIATYIPVARNSTSWTVGHLIDAPDVGAGTHYKIKIRVISEAPNDFSDAAFSITSTAPPAGSIAVTSPNGGESWEQGSNHNITWTPTGITSGTYRITLLKGGVPAGIVASGLPLSPHSYNWTVGNTDSPFQGAAANYRIQVEHQGGTALGFSNNAFAISEPPETPADTITVTSPNRGENWRKGSSRDITWTSSGIVMGTYKITLWQGTTNKGVIATGLPAAQHLFKWTVGSVTGGSVPTGAGYKVKVELQAEPIADDSDVTFTIGLPLQATTLNPPHEVTQLDRPPFEIMRIPKLEIRDLTYNYRQKCFEAWGKNTGNAPYVGRFRWEWFTDCGTRSGHKDIPPSQSAYLESPEGMHFSFDCNPPLRECSIFGIFSIAPVTMDGKRLKNAQVQKHVPRFEYNQFLLSEQRFMLRFLHGSTYVNKNQGYTITSNDAYDYDFATREASFVICFPVKNCGGTAGKGDHLWDEKLYWSVHHWPSNTHAVYPQYLSNRGANRQFYSDSPIEPGHGVFFARRLSLPVQSGRYEVRVHMGPTWQGHQICSIFLTFADNLIH